MCIRDRLSILAMLARPSETNLAISGVGGNCSRYSFGGAMGWICCMFTLLNCVIASPVAAGCGIVE